MKRSAFDSLGVEDEMFLSFGYLSMLETNIVTVLKMPIYNQVSEEIEDAVWWECWQERHLVFWGE